jgi:hypothetical protein
MTNPSTPTSEAVSLEIVAWRWDNSSPLCPDSWGLTADRQRATMARDLALPVEALTAHAPAMAAIERLTEENERMRTSLSDCLDDLEYLASASDSAYARPDDDTIKQGRAALNAGKDRT